LGNKKQNLIINSSVYFDILGCLVCGISSVPLMKRFLIRKGVNKSSEILLRQVKRLIKDGYISNGEVYYFNCVKCNLKYIGSEFDESKVCVCGGSFEKKKKVGNERSYIFFPQKINEEFYNLLQEKDKSVVKHKKLFLKDELFAEIILGLMSRLIGKDFTIRKIMEYYTLNFNRIGKINKISKDKLHFKVMNIAEKIMKENKKELEIFNKALKDVIIDKK
jgi:hypothetical protein